MKLIIDREVDRKHCYSVSFGIDYDILIGRWDFNTLSIHKDDMAELDRLVTNSPDTVFCICNMKHPLLMKDFSEKESSGFFNNDHSFKRKLRNFYAVRLRHRKYKVDLLEFGKKYY